MDGVYIEKTHITFTVQILDLLYIYIYYIAMFDCQRYPLVILLRKDNLKFAWKNI